MPCVEEAAKSGWFTLFARILIIWFTRVFDACLVNRTSLRLAGILGFISKRGESCPLELKNIANHTSCGFILRADSLLERREGLLDFLDMLGKLVQVVRALTQGRAGGLDPNLRRL